MAASAEAPRAMIEVVDLHRAMGGVPVLKGVNLRVPAGKTSVLLGMSGSGKTVLLKHLIGLFRPDRGEVWMDGKDLSTLGRKELAELRRNIGILFQSDALFDSMTVFDNVAFALREQLHLSKAEVKDRVREILREVSLEDVAGELPPVLSGGMRKRVAFARAAVTRPRILLYDEPTAGLDPLTTQSVIEIIDRARAGGVTTLAVIFDVAAAFAVADELAFLHEGMIVEAGPPQTLIRSGHPAVRAFLREWLEQRDEAHA